jgi:thiol-disulfide isomerase/thioredoxin
MVTILGSILAAALVTLAPLTHATDWLAGRPAAFNGKVVIVDVFTFDCINCKHVVPELRKLHASIPPSDLEIVGIHSPETPYERDRQNVIDNLESQGITWPVAIDNDFALWRAFNIEYWPTQLIFDRNGRLRQTVIGEGQDAVVERTVRELISER